MRKSISFPREKYNEDNFLIQTTMTIAPATVCSTAYCVDGEKRVLPYVLAMAQQQRQKLTQQQRQNSNIAEAITHKPIQYNKYK